MVFGTSEDEDNKRPRERDGKRQEKTKRNNESSKAKVTVRVPKIRTILVTVECHVDVQMDLHVAMCRVTKSLSCCSAEMMSEQDAVIIFFRE